jgi:hypothetical protein
LVQAFSIIEPQVLTGRSNAGGRRYLITRFGEIRFHRWQTRSAESYGYPLDRALGTHPPTTLVASAPVMLATMLGIAQPADRASSTPGPRAATAR